MAFVDVKANAIVIRIVYDGPPFAGKTTSVRTLARSLMRTVDTPLESDGRTLFFDWLEYTGGVFEGRQIRCQIVSVPGQLELAARRRVLLESADVVVFVADTGDPQAVQRSVVAIGEMVDMLHREQELPVGVVVQANKRDLPTAVPRDEVRAALGDDFAQTALTESVAEAGLGIRETFVLAVRVALDRIREQLGGGDPSDLESRLSGLHEGAEQLLATLEQLPLGPPPEPARAVKVEDASSQERAPKLPDTRAPTGAIWPPVEGRMILHEAAMSGLIAHRADGGDWAAGMGGTWRVHSAANAQYHDFDEGRGALVTWAGEHASLGALISESRSVVLAETGDGTWRLWQVIRVMPGLRGWLADAAQLELPLLYRRLVAAAAVLGEAHVRLAGTRLPATIDTVGRGAGGAQYVALMPAVGAPPPLPIESVESSVADQLARLLSSELLDRRAELGRTVVSMWRGILPWDSVVTAAIAGKRPSTA
jgi:signal recognition particle receptor subunit beta